MHVLMSCFYLFLAIVLIYTYLLIAQGVFILCRAGWLRIKAHFRPDDGNSAECSTLLRRGDKITALLLLFATVAFSIFTYMNQRAEWMGEDNAHFKAKEYFVAGQVVYGVRTFFRNFFQVDSVVTLPFQTLQEAIYNRGIQCLPEDDGERGVWTDLWFVYLYAKKNDAPKGTSNVRYSPRMTALLDRAWSAIEQEASHPFADRQMERQNYFRNFSGQAFYYHLNKGYYAGKKVGSSVYYTRDAKLMARSRKLVQWLGELESKWQASEEALTFLKANPKVAAIRQVVHIMEISDIIINEIIEKNFSCENDSVRDYLRERAAFAGDGNSTPPYQKMRDKTQAKRLYDVVFNTRVSIFQKHILKNYCGMEAAGKEDESIYTDQVFPDTPEKRKIRAEESKMRSLRSLFPDELKALEEWNNGRKIN